jgi:hypothetical protein
MDNFTIADPSTRRVCTLSGVKGKVALQQELVTLKDLEKSLTHAIHEANLADDDEAFWQAMIVATKIVQASCDLTIALLEAGTGPVGKGVSVLYDTSKIVVDALNGEFDAKEGFKYAANVNADAVLAVAEHSGAQWGTVASRLKVLANLADDLRDFFRQRGAQLSSGSISSAKRSALGVLQRLRAQITKTEEALAACDIPGTS